MTAPEFVGARARLNPSVRMDLSLKALDVRNLSVAGLLTYRFTSARARHFQNSTLRFSRRGVRTGDVLQGVGRTVSAPEDCIFRAVGHSNGEMDVQCDVFHLRRGRLQGDTGVTPYSMRDRSIGIPEHPTPCPPSTVCARAVSNRAAKENETLLAYGGISNAFAE